MSLSYEIFLIKRCEECFTDIYPYEISLLCACVDNFTDFTAPGLAVNCHCMMILGFLVLDRFNRKAGTGGKHS